MTIGDGIALAAVSLSVAAVASVWIIVTNWCKVEQAKLADRRKR